METIRRREPKATRRSLPEQRNNITPDPRYFIYPRDPYGNYFYDQYGIVIVDSRNGWRVIPMNSPQPAPVQSPPSKIIRGSAELSDLFIMDDDFFLEEKEKTKGGENTMMQVTDQSFWRNTMPGVPTMVSPVDILSTVEAPEGDIPEKVRYTKMDMYMLGLSDEELMKYLLNKAFKNHPDLRFALTPTLGGLHELIIFRNGILAAKFYCDLCNYAGFGLPIMHGIVGKQYRDNHIVVPLGATKAVEQCITNAAYNGDFGVDVITQAIFERDMLPEHIYATIDMSAETPGNGRGTYQQFGKVIELIDRYFPLKSRYRLTNYESNSKFMLVSDNLVAPFNGVKPQSLDTVIILDGNKLIIKEPSSKKTIIIGG